MCGDFFAAGGVVGAQHDEGGEKLALARVRHADHAGLADRGVLHEHVLDFGRGDVDAAFLDHFRGAADEDQLPGCGKVAHISGAEETIGREGFGGELRAGFSVAAGDVAADFDQAVFA